MALLPVFRGTPKEPLWIMRNGVMVPAWAEDPCDVACCPEGCAAVCPDLAACLELVDGETTRDVEIVVSGIGNQNCSDCSPLNGTFIITHGIGGSNGACQFTEYQTPPEIQVSLTPCSVLGGHSLGYFIKCDEFTKRVAVIWSQIGIGSIVFRVDDGEAIAAMIALCNDEVVDLPFFGDTTTSCTGSGASATIQLV